jgi:hypothetical protein
MLALSALGKGRSNEHNAEDALRLIQLWGRHFEQKRNKFPIFFDTFVKLRASNLRFPPEEPAGPASPEPPKQRSVIRKLIIYRTL